MHPSSHATPLRILVMLLCFIVMPVVAIRGTSLPDSARRLLEGYWGKGNVAAKDSLPEAPPFRPGGATVTLGAPPKWDSQVYARSQAAPGGLGGAREPRRFEGSDSQELRPSVRSGSMNLAQGGYDPASRIGAEVDPSDNAQATAYVDPFGRATRERREDARPDQNRSRNEASESMLREGAPVNGDRVVSQTPARIDAPDGGIPGGGVPTGTPARGAGDGSTTERPAHTVPSATMTATPPLSHVDQFASIEQRLRDLGAVYYRLETWGNRGRRYRFYCNVAIAHSPSHIQHFEATNPDAFQAMTKVLQDVEEWRSRR